MVGVGVWMGGVSGWWCLVGGWFFLCGCCLGYKGGLAVVDCYLDSGGVVWFCSVFLVSVRLCVG